MTPFLLGLLAGAWLTVSAIAWVLFYADDEEGPRGLWRLWIAVAAPGVVAWQVGRVLVEWVRESWEGRTP